MIIHHQPAPGYIHDPRPDRYPTRADWPRPGTTGHHVKRPGESIVLRQIWHGYYATFQDGYTMRSFDLQDFIVEGEPCE